ncbi:MAG: hypothetical protein MUF58_18415, partial [Arcicella sp.]|nr:hypothetical protein [Arcicella sp.]
GVSPQSRGNHGLYIVNAWVAENKICVGQEKVLEKSNELDALPKIIKSIDITDAVATIDATKEKSKISHDFRRIFRVG